MQNICTKEVRRSKCISHNASSIDIVTIFFPQTSKKLLRIAKFILTTRK
jgi:hypothetical protein